MKYIQKNISKITILFIFSISIFANIIAEKEYNYNIIFINENSSNKSN